LLTKNHVNDALENLGSRIDIQKLSVLIKILTLNIAYVYYPKTDSNGVPYKNEQRMLFVADHLITTASDIALLQEVDKFTDRSRFSEGYRINQAHWLAIHFCILWNREVDNTQALFK
jgi:hypothetical protein